MSVSIIKNQPFCDSLKTAPKIQNGSSEAALLAFKNLEHINAQPKHVILKKKRPKLLISREPEREAAIILKPSENLKQIRESINDDNSIKLARLLDKLGIKIGKFLGSGASGNVYVLKEVPFVIKIYKPKKKRGKSAFVDGQRGAGAALGISGNMITAKKIFVFDHKTKKVVVIDRYSDLKPHHEHLAVILPLVKNAKTLESLIKDGLSLPQIKRFAIDWITQIFTLHDKGILHGDHKPDNILVDEYGIIRIADFGLARRLPPSKEYLETTGEGTVAYQPPEVKNRKYYLKSDSWTLGIMLYQMATGKNPFQGEYWETLHGDRNEISFPENMPLKLQGLIYDLLHYDPNQRPNMYESFIRVLFMD